MILFMSNSPFLFGWWKILGAPSRAWFWLMSFKDRSQELKRRERQL